ncbi:proline dehydrogenase family protein [Streptomyces violaceorubidus]
MLGPVILAASRSDRMRRLVSAAPVTKPVVDRFIPGETVDQIVPIVRELTDQGLELTMDVVGEDITTPAQAEAARDAYLELIDRLKPLELGTRAEMSVKLSMFGQALDGGHELALDNVRPVVEAAAEIGTTVTLDAEDHTTLDRHVRHPRELGKGFPQTGCVIQANLFPHRGRRAPPRRQRLSRTVGEGRLQGARRGRVPAAPRDRQGVCPHLRTLMEGEGYPMIGSHDPRLISIGQELARTAGRKLDEYEFQMLYGIRGDEHLRLAAEGHRMRVYTAYGTDWYGYFMRRLAEKPANLRFFARSMVSKG